MPEILLFGEDYAHEVVLRTLLERLAGEQGFSVSIQVRSSSRGHGRMMRELREFLKELETRHSALPDLFVVARDGNCQGYSERAREIRETMKEFRGNHALAIPDPHIERWLLLDGRAFKKVLGKGCEAPDQKCDRDRYKQLLDDAVRKTGVAPLLGGLEYAENLVQAMDLDHACRKDASFRRLLEDLRAGLGIRK